MRQRSVAQLGLLDGLARRLNRFLSGVRTRSKASSATGNAPWATAACATWTGSAIGWSWSSSASSGTSNSGPTSPPGPEPPRPTGRTGPKHLCRGRGPMLSADARVETDPFRTTFPVHRPPQSRPLPHPAPNTDLFRGLNTSLRYPGQPPKLNSR